MDTRHLAAGPLSSTAGRRGEPFEFYLGGWHADYPDPNNFVDILLNGNNIREANNNNTAYFNVPSVNRRLEAAAKLTGQARYRGLPAARRRHLAQPRAVGVVLVREQPRLHLDQGGVLLVPPDLRDESRPRLPALTAA